MKIKRGPQQGFTLIELMIVVAIVGVLAVLATYGVRKYISYAKTAEARNALGALNTGSVMAFTVESPTAGHAMCAKATAAVPKAAAKIKGTKYQSTEADWSNAADAKNNAGFPCLKFEMTAPQYYQYNYTTAGGLSKNNSSFTATARGDLDGDGKLSTFTVTGKIQNGTLTAAPSIGEISPEE